MRLIALAAVAVVACHDAGTAQRYDGGSVLCPAHPENCMGKCCGATCTDTDNDTNNCGDCNNVCPKGNVCVVGRCGCPPTGIACGMAQSCCGTAGCKSLDSDRFNCGACGRECADGTCSGGQCHCGGAVCPSTQRCCAGACSDAPCAAAAPDLATPMLPLCTCNNAPFGPCPVSHSCVGMDCCANDASLGVCSAGGCTPQNWPP
jgi:hypothetical protein